MNYSIPLRTARGCASIEDMSTDPMILTTETVVLSPQAVSYQSRRALAYWAEDRGAEPLQEVILTLLAALRDGRTVTITY